jgi:hypothetical protein
MRKGGRRMDSGWTVRFGGSSRVLAVAFGSVEAPGCWRLWARGPGYP